MNVNRVAVSTAFFCQGFAFAALITEFMFRPPIWLHLILWLPGTLILSLGLMRPLKGIKLAAQFMNKASEARHDD